MGARILEWARGDGHAESNSPRSAAPQDLKQTRFHRVDKHFQTCCASAAPLLRSFRIVARSGRTELSAAAASLAIAKSRTRVRARMQHSATGRQSSPKYSPAF